ncbi:MAG: hypothetical protein ABJC67_11965 [Lentilitoribacter sp.]
MSARSELFPAVLLYIDESLDRHGPDVIAKADRFYLVVHPNIQNFHSSECINALASRYICVRAGRFGDIRQARDHAMEAGNGVKVGHHSPNDGAQMWFDQMAVPTDASNPVVPEFHRGRIKHKAGIELRYYAYGSETSKRSLIKYVVADAAIDPDEKTLDFLLTTTPYPAKFRWIMKRLWSKFDSFRLHQIQ